MKRRTLAMLMALCLLLGSVSVLALDPDTDLLIEPSAVTVTVEEGYEYALVPEDTDIQGDNIPWMLPKLETLSFENLTEGQTYLLYYREMAIDNDPPGEIQGPVEVVPTGLNFFRITWEDEDGTVLAVDKAVAAGEFPEFPGDSPTKEATAQYTYTFDKWVPDLEEVTDYATYTASYTEELNYYTITWEDEDGTMLDERQVAYGEVPEFEGDEPTKEATEEYTFSFSGWMPEPEAVTGDATYTAVFTSKPISEENPEPEPDKNPAPEANYDEGVGWGAEVLHADLEELSPDDDWFRRSRLPDYAVDLYVALVLGSDLNTIEDLLVRDKYFRLATSNNPPVVGQKLDEVEETAYADPVFYSDLGSVLPVTVDTLLEESNNQIDPSIADKSVRYGNLALGDIVRTSSFNGILVKKIVKTDNPNFETELSEAKSRIAEAYHAFDRDHPEVFWLSGKSKVRTVTVTASSGGKKVQTAYLFFVLVDNAGFNLRAEDFNSGVHIAEAAKQRDAEAEAILATLRDMDTLEQIKGLNDWLTKHNEYNTTPDLSTIGYAPHRCITALAGSIGLVGPVCDGYSRAFKLLCDRLGIPCLLENGFARSSDEHEGEYHMWNAVKMPDGNWYGVDVTWDDPKVSGVSGAVSGRENEDFLLVGNETEIHGLRFEVSHKPNNQLTGTLALDGTFLSPTAYSGAVAEPELPFTDVQPEDWFYPYVQYVYEAGIMNGTGDGKFSPNTTTTRAQLVTMLYRLEGSPEVSEAAVFDDVPADTWYTAPVAWANEKGVVTGYGDGSFGPQNELTREQLALMLWRYAEKPEGAGELSQFADADQVDGWAADALRWCVGKGIITGKGGGVLDPLGVATRAEIATMLMRFMKLEG